MPTFALNISVGTDCKGGCVVLQSGNAYSLLPVPDTYGENAWLLLCSFLVVSMQLGFAMLEVGSCRQAHRMTILAKNVMDSAISSVAFWLFCEYRNSTLVHDAQGRMQNELLMFHWTFCATTVTICSGSMAERTHMVAYLSYAVLMSLVIYPYVAHGAWVNEGFLSSEFNGKYDNGYKYHDFAGSGVVHLVGGISALLGNILLGRRIMPRVDPFNSPIKEYAETSENGALGLSALPTREQLVVSDIFAQKTVDTFEASELHAEWLRRFDDKDRDEMEFKGCHYLQATGMFTLFVGWFGFNAGSSYSMLEGAANASATIVAETVALNTALAAGAGGVGIFMYSYFVEKDLDLGKLCNGVLCGLVSITAPCAVATKLASVLIGLTASAFVYPFICFIMRKLKLDDPVEAIPVHAGCGLFGVLAVAFCRPECENLQRLQSMSADQARFCSDEHQVGKQLLAQAWGAFTEIWFTASISLLLWGTFAVCECVVALEEDDIEEVYRICCKQISSDQRDVDYAGLSAALQSCPVALDVFRQNGWTDGKFTKAEHKTVGHILRVMKLLRTASHATIGSALEIKKLRLMKVLARFLRSSLRAHNVMIVRLRIPPGAELSGLGAAGLDGNRILSKTRRLMDTMERETKSALDASNAVLEREIRDLDDMVRGQDLLLSVLAKRRRRNLVISSSTECSPIGSAIDSPSSSSYNRYLSNGSAPSDQLSQGGSSQPSSLSRYPLANSIGKSGRYMSPLQQPVEDHGMNQVALKLLEVVQNQQQLLSNVIPQKSLSPRTPQAGRVSPRTPGRTPTSTNRIDV